MLHGKVNCKDFTDEKPCLRITLRSQIKFSCIRSSRREHCVGALAGLESQAAENHDFIGGAGFTRLPLPASEAWNGSDFHGLAVQKGLVHHGALTLPHRAGKPACGQSGEASRSVMKMMQLRRAACRQTIRVCGQVCRHAQHLATPQTGVLHVPQRLNPGLADRVYCRLARMDHHEDLRLHLWHTKGTNCA